MGMGVPLLQVPGFFVEFSKNILYKERYKYSTVPYYGVWLEVIITS